ncbi:MAG: amidohydrolase family protein [Deltaproteobacteria bacterium]|nr:amidohydrolase family protein [Deltaproteobacteria bacterium]
MANEKQKMLITNANLFDGNHEPLQENVNILVEGNLIRTITKDAIQGDGVETVIDAKNKTVIPGLVDCHTHVMITNSMHLMDQMTHDEAAARATRIARDMILRGFTTIRDVGGGVFGLKNAIDAGYVEGPRIYPSGAAISQTCGHSDFRQNRAQRHPNVHNDSPFMRQGHFAIADGVPEILRAVRSELFKGASQIKIMAGGGAASKYDPLETVQYTLEEMKACVQAAADYGTYVCAHIHNKAAMLRAADAGIKCFEHASFMDDEVARRMADDGIILCAQYAMADLVANRKIPFDAEVLYQKTERVGKAILKTGELVQKYGIKNVYGTDMPGPREVQSSQSKEFGGLKKQFGNFQGLKAATGNTTQLFEMTTCLNPYPEGKLGCLHEGSYADLLVVKENPLADLTVLEDSENLELIVKDGEIFKNKLN